MEDDSKKGIDFLSSANTNVQIYQAKLLEVAQANMQFAIEFAQRLAAIRSLVQFPSVITEFTGRRIAMFQKHSTELTELSTSDGHPKTKIHDVRAATAHTHVLSVSQNDPALR